MQVGRRVGRGEGVAFRARTRTCAGRRSLARVAVGEGRQSTVLWRGRHSLRGRCGWPPRRFARNRDRRRGAQSAPAGVEEAVLVGRRRGGRAEASAGVVGFGPSRVEVVRWDSLAFRETEDCGDVPSTFSVLFGALATGDDAVGLGEVFGRASHVVRNTVVDRG
jgi:hypothetical protein